MGMAKLRVLFPAITGPPRGPAAFRVSTTRHGVTGMNNSPEVEGTVAVDPFPLRPVVCGEFGDESVSVSVADRDPAAVGVKIIHTLQLLFAASKLPQV